jgi:hypothetical protein
VRYGIRRRTEAGQKVTMESSYSRISNLIDLEDQRFGKFQDIAVLPVTELLDLERELAERPPSAAAAQPLRRTGGQV